MRIWEVEQQHGKKVRGADAQRTDFEQNVRKLKGKRRSVDAEKPVKPVKPS